MKSLVKVLGAIALGSLFIGGVANIFGMGDSLVEGWFYIFQFFMVLTIIGAVLLWIGAWLRGEKRPNQS